ncbi:MAG: hypothetical protein ACLP05_02070 [Candidatus Kryptoniota bacterium]
MIYRVAFFRDNEFLFEKRIDVQLLTPNSERLRMVVVFVPKLPDEPAAFIKLQAVLM